MDLTGLFAPVWLCLGVAFLYPSTLETPGWVYLVGVLLIDVGHVWSTVFRTVLDGDARSRMGALLWGVPLLVFGGCVAIHASSSTLFWRLMAYLALFHFMKQQVGFSALYRLRQGLSFATVEARVERWTIQALVLAPVVYWHANLPRKFAWFVPGARHEMAIVGEPGGEGRAIVKDILFRVGTL